MTIDGLDLVTANSVEYRYMGKSFNTKLLFVQHVFSHFHVTSIEDV